MASQLHNIRMKLEEKRRLIESEKRRMEVVMSKQRQKVGKAAFLQAVTKVSSRDQIKKNVRLEIVFITYSTPPEKEVVSGTVIQKYFLQLYFRNNFTYLGGSGEFGLRCWTLIRRFLSSRPSQVCVQIILLMD